MRIIGPETVEETRACPMIKLIHIDKKEYMCSICREAADAPDEAQSEGGSGK